MDLERFEKEFTSKFRLKKIVNIAVCLVIFVLGITAFIYKARYEGGVLTCFREMTVCGTVFSSIVALLYVLVSAYEFAHNKEIEKPYLYYLRLSSATAEFIILIIVLIGYLPFIPAKPVIGRYDMINMHVLVPVLTLYSFLFNDPPRGRLTPVQRLGGLCFLLLYTLGEIICILLYIIPEEKIPYFFLNVRHQPLWLTLLAVVVIYGLGYLLSWLFSELNRKCSWYWYRIAAKRK